MLCVALPVIVILYVATRCGNGPGFIVKWNSCNISERLPIGASHPNGEQYRVVWMGKVVLCSLDLSRITHHMTTCTARRWIPLGSQIVQGGRRAHRLDYDGSHLPRQETSWTHVLCCLTPTWDMVGR